MGAGPFNISIGDMAQLLRVATGQLRQSRIWKRGRGCIYVSMWTRPRRFIPEAELAKVQKGRQLVSCRRT